MLSAPQTSHPQTHTQSILLFEMTNERKNKDVFGAIELIVQNGLCGSIATHSLLFLCGLHWLIWGPERCVWLFLTAIPIPFEYSVIAPSCRVVTSVGFPCHGPLFDATFVMLLRGGLCRLFLSQNFGKKRETHHRLMHVYAARISFLAYSTAKCLKVKLYQAVLISFCCVMI